MQSSSATPAFATTLHGTGQTLVKQPQHQSSHGSNHHTAATMVDPSSNYNSVTNQWRNVNHTSNSNIPTNHEMGKAQTALQHETLTEYPAAMNHSNAASGTPVATATALLLSEAGGGDPFDWCNRMNLQGSDHNADVASAEVQNQVAVSNNNSSNNNSTTNTSFSSYVRMAHNGHVVLDTHGRAVTVERWLGTAPLRSDVSSRPGPGGKSLLYLSGSSVARTLNEAFGFDGWDLHIIKTEQIVCTQNDHDKKKPPSWTVAYLSQVRVTHRVSGTSKEDVGAGDAVDRVLATAITHAIKASVTDALKRAARHFGEKLGNALYEGTGSNKFTLNKAPHTVAEALDRFDQEQQVRFGLNSVSTNSTKPPPKQQPPPPTNGNIKRESSNSTNNGANNTSHHAKAASAPAATVLQSMPAPQRLLPNSHSSAAASSSSSMVHQQQPPHNHASTAPSNPLSGGVEQNRGAHPQQQQGTLHQQQQSCPRPATTATTTMTDSTNRPLPQHPAHSTFGSKPQERVGGNGSTATATANPSSNTNTTVASSTARPPPPPTRGGAFSARGVGPSSLVNPAVNGTNGALLATPPLGASLLTQYQQQQVQQQQHLQPEQGGPSSSTNRRHLSHETGNALATEGPMKKFKGNPYNSSA